MLWEVRRPWGLLAVGTEGWGSQVLDCPPLSGGGGPSSARCWCLKRLWIHCRRLRGGGLTAPALGQRQLPVWSLGSGTGPSWYAS